MAFIITAKSKAYQKRKYSLKDKNKLVGSIITSIPKEIAKLMDLKDGDQIIWCYDDRGNDIKAAMVFKKLKRIG